MAFLEQFTSGSLQLAKQSWIKDAIELDYPTIDIEKAFSYAENHIDYKNVVNDSLSYAIFDDKSKECLAVVDIVVSKNNPQKTYIKMLTVDLSPKLISILLKDQMEELEQIIDVYSRATLGTILLTFSHKADIVKIYGRSQSMRLLLKSIESSINTNTNFKCTTKWEGSWLTVCQN